MSSYETYESFRIANLDATDAIDKLRVSVDLAMNSGWTKLYIDTDEYGEVHILGCKPPDPEEIRKAKEKRRKQYERLKKEFEG